MTVHAPIPKTGPHTAKSKAKKGNSSPRSLNGCTPHIRSGTDIAVSGWTSDSAPKDSGTVIAAGKFKATCLQLLDAAEKGQSITITKRGKVVARLVPPEPEKPKEFVPLWGRMRGQVKIFGDIVSPDFEAWGMTDPRKKKTK